MVEELARTTEERNQAPSLINRRDEQLNQGEGTYLGMTVQSGKTAKGAWKHYGLKIQLTGRSSALTFGTFDTDMVDKLGLLNGDRVHIAWEDETRKNSKGEPVTFHNIVSLAEVPEEPSEPLPPKSSQASPEPAGGTPKVGSRPNGWTEAFSQSREAHEESRASIERQTALIQARELIGDLLATLTGTDAERIAFIERTWPILARRAMATLSEIGQKEEQ